MKVDYLIVGAGASGLVFADRLLTNSDATMALIDRRPLPGGHWVDGYPFVRLHAPSVLYGVDSAPLGHEGLDDHGLNAGLGHCARLAEIMAHFETCLHERLIPSGRVHYLPAHEMDSQGQVRRCIDGELIAIDASVVVDAGYFTNAVPKTEPPPFNVAAGSAYCTPADLPTLARDYSEFVVAGAGKTGMDAVTFLLGLGAATDQIRWIVPRDPWVFNRVGLQSHPKFLTDMLRLTAAQLEAMAYSTSIEEFEDGMEAGDVWLRVTDNARPSMFHAACSSQRECEVLRTVNPVRLGYIQSVEPGQVLLDGGRLAMGRGTLLVNCTASALTRQRPRPIFEPGRITMQILRFPAPCFSAAMLAEIERHVPDNEKNDCAKPTGVTDTSADFLRTTLIQQQNQIVWNRYPELKAFYRSSRLDAMARLVRSGDRTDPELRTFYERIQRATSAAAENIPRLLAA
ncbi:MAG: NAD(P)-binding protein [Pseudomonadota bacterium]